MSHQPDNIFAGTQVVSQVEVRGTNNSLIHPRGAVGVVTRTPTGDQSKFLVRFPDGFEASLAREQLDVLKHFKDRLPDGESATSDFDLERLVIYRCVVGSRAYGLNIALVHTHFLLISIGCIPTVFCIHFYVLCGSSLDKD